MRTGRIAALSAAASILLGCSALAPTSSSNPSRSASDQPFSVERFSLPGPVSGVMAKIDLADRRVRVEVAMADDRDPDGAGPCAGLLETPSIAARKHAYRLAINASFFAVPNVKSFEDRKVPYFVGNCGYPQGWHFSGDKLISAPAKENLRATLIVHRDGRVSLRDRVMELPADTKFAVSGNAMMLTHGKITPPAVDILRHPRSAVGISADGRTLFLLAVDGRQEAHSRGVTLAELAQMLLTFGADSAINLDGGGSTAMVLRDPASGVYTVANQPSDLSSNKLPLHVERPVIDVVGIVVE